MKSSVPPNASRSAWFACLHWYEYALEALQLGLFMLSACLVVALVEYPGSPLHGFMAQAWVRRFLVGLCMGLTAMALIYSGWGKRSGAHMNPAVTLTFLRLGKIQPVDAAMYVLAQFLGASLGVLLSAQLLGSVIAHPAVDFVVTSPAAGGVAAAFVAEFGISGVLMLLVLGASNSVRLRPFTGALAGLLITLYISFEAPISGMSMNPARTFGSALVAGRFEHVWVYFMAPMLGMLLAAECYQCLAARRGLACAKLQHDSRVPCIFCTGTSRRA